MMEKWFKVPAAGPKNVPLARVIELPSGRVLAHFKNLELVGMPDDATVATMDDNKEVLSFWDLPLQAPKRLVLGIPSGLGLLILSLAWWRRRRKRGLAMASAPGG
jgi:hypothetical protein